MITQGKKKNILDISTWTSGRNPVKLLPVNFTLMANWTGVSVVGVTEEERLVVIGIIFLCKKKHELLIKSRTKTLITRQIMSGSLHGGEIHVTS